MVRSRRGGGVREGPSHDRTGPPETIGSFFCAAPPPVVEIPGQVNVERVLAAIPTSEMNRRPRSSHVHLPRADSPSRLANDSTIEVVTMTGIDIVPSVSQLGPDARARHRHGGRTGRTSPRSSAPRRIPALIMPDPEHAAVRSPARGRTRQQRGQANPTVLDEDFAERTTTDRRRPRHCAMGRSRALRTTGEQLKTAYPPRCAAAAQMRKALRAYLSEQALDAKVVYDVVLAADEAFTNAVSHAGGADHLIRVSACVSQSEAAVEVQDSGGGFTLRRSGPRSVPDVRRANGRGVFLIESMMDEVSVRSGPRGTIVRMVRRLALEARRRDDPGWRGGRGARFRREVRSATRSPTLLGREPPGSAVETQPGCRETCQYARVRHMTDQHPRELSARGIPSLRSRGSAPLAAAIRILPLERKRLTAAGERLGAGAGTLFAVGAGLEHLNLQSAVCADVHLAGLHLAA